MSTLNDTSDDIFFENELTKEKRETFLLVALLVFCVNEISAFQAIGLLHFIRNCEKWPQNKITYNHVCVFLRVICICTYLHVYA